MAMLSSPFIALAQLPESTWLELASRIRHAARSSRLPRHTDCGRIASGIVRSGEASAEFVTADGRWRSTSYCLRHSRSWSRRIGGGVASPIDEGGDEILAGERIVVVTNYPAHYRLPLFEAMARAARARWMPRCRVMFLARGDA